MTLENLHAAEILGLIEEHKRYPTKAMILVRWTVEKYCRDQYLEGLRLKECYCE